MFRIMFGVWFLIIYAPLLARPGVDIRPILDRVGYCWEPAQMNRLMRHLESSWRLSTDYPEFVAGIAPHDDYLYAGSVYLPLFSRIHAKEVVVFGVTHRTIRQTIGDPTGIIIMDTFKRWMGPYGPVCVSPLRDRIREAMPVDMIVISNEAHRLEHSIEGMIPFLQYQVRNLKITPIMVTAMDLERMEVVGKQLSTIISAYMDENQLEPGRDVFFLISCDANHYGPDFDNTVFGTGSTGHAAAVANDRRIAEDCLSGSLTRDGLARFLEETRPDRALWCGRYSVPFGLTVLRQLFIGSRTDVTVNGVVLRYSDSYSAGPLPLRRMGLGVTAPFSLDHWVGHLSTGYWLTGTGTETEQEQNQRMVRQEENK